MKQLHFQKGMATVFVAVVVLVIMTIMVLFAARVGVFDQRMAANEARYKEAFAIAEAGLNHASERFEAEFNRLYDGSTTASSAATLNTIVANSTIAANTEIDGTAPEANEPYYTATIVDSGNNFNGVPIFTVIGTGVGSDGTGTATVQRQFTMAHVFGGLVPDVPVIVGGAVGTGGNFNVVANPDGANEGVPVAIWSNDVIAASAASATCHAEFYDGNNAQCSNPSGNTENISRGTNPASDITVYDPAYPDLLPNDPNFPDDLFNFVFGVPLAEWQVKRNEAASNNQLVTDCSEIIALGADAGSEHPLWWVDGPCDITGGTLGSVDAPIILVIEDNELKGSGNAVINGIVYLFDNPDEAGTPSAALTGTMEIVGSLISDVGGNAMDGSYSVVYDPNLVGSFVSNGNSYTFAWVPGSWRDF